MSKVLVTGGAGFIGSHMVGHLVAGGHTVRVLDNLCSGKQENLSSMKAKIEFIKGDIRNKQDVDRAMQGIEKVAHFAALRSVPESMADPQGYTETNVLGTVQLLEAAVSAKVQRFVFVSSCSVYGEIEQPFRENQAPQPISIYAANKWVGEEMSTQFSRGFGLSTVSLRFFNVFGPRQSLEDEYAVVVPKFITSILNQKSPPIYGDGKQSRDFIYVGDVVQAVEAALTAEGLTGEVFNVGAGQAHTVLELLETINQILGAQIKPTFENARPGDILHASGSIEKVKQQLQWQPSIGFEEGLKQTVQYFKEHL